MKTLIIYLLIIEALHLIAASILISFALEFRRLLREEMYELSAMLKSRINGFLDVFKRSQRSGADPTPPGRRERE